MLPLRRILVTPGWGFLLGVCLLLVLLQGCATTSSITELGSALSDETDTEAPPPIPVMSAGDDSEEQVKAWEKILRLLKEADNIRQGVLNDPSLVRFWEKSKDAFGKERIRVYILLSYDDSESKLAEARRLYGEVLEMDPSNPQAMLGMGNISLMHGMTLRTRWQVMRVRLLVEEDKLSEKEEWLLTKAKKVLQRRLGNSLAAADQKFIQVLDLNPRNASAHLGRAMAVALGLTGTEQDAERASEEPDWQRALSMFADIDENGFHTPRTRSVFYVWYGFVMEQMKDKNAARAFYAKASQLEEPYTWAEWAMSREEALFIEELEEQKKAEKQVEE